MTQIYRPSAEESLSGAGDLKKLLVERGLAQAKQIAAAETIIRQSPGTRLIDVLLALSISLASEAWSAAGSARAIG